MLLYTDLFQCNEKFIFSNYGHVFIIQRTTQSQETFNLPTNKWSNSSASYARQPKTENQLHSTGKKNNTSPTRPRPARLLSFLSLNTAPINPHTQPTISPLYTLALSKHWPNEERTRSPRISSCARPTPRLRSSAEAPRFIGVCMYIPTYTCTCPISRDNGFSRRVLIERRGWSNREIERRERVCEVNLRGWTRELRMGEDRRLRGEY